MTKTYKCIECGKDCLWGRSKINKYCDSVCQQNYIWKNVTVPRIESGEATSNSAKTLKKYLIEKVGELCSDCGIGGRWNEKPLILQLDHIDGNSDNNFVSNLRLLCPNCHSQTDTFGSKGNGSRYSKHTKRNLYLQEYKRK